MSDPDSRRRLDELISALPPSPPERPAIGDAAASDPGADADRVGTAHVDDLLRRVSTLTSALRDGHDRGWDEVDRLAAKLLLADLSAIAATIRALNTLSASRLARALADLRAAGADVERTVKDASGSHT